MTISFPSPHWRALRYWSLASVAISSLAACSSTLSPCYNSASPSVTLHVTDAKTGGDNANNAMAVLAPHGSAAGDTVRGPTTAAVSGYLQFFGGPGLFDITVKKAGYADWIRTNLTVASAQRTDACTSPVNVDLVVSLVPAVSGSVSLGVSRQH